MSGYSGIGKSALVHELYKPIVHERACFISGKFDQYKRDIPYATIADAFRGLVPQILSESEERVLECKRRLLDAVGTSGQLLIDLIPELGLILGPQPPLPNLSPKEAQNRFRMVFRRFIRVFTAEEHPLALFLDDLQWADPASLELLEELVTDREVRFLLVVGAYRDNEVTFAHPLTLMLEQARKAGAKISNIVLSPLSHEHLTMLVGDALHCGRDAAGSLAHVIHEKTGGNPFFAIQFLVALHDEHLVTFDPRALMWRWDAAEVRARGFTDNVVDLMIDKLRRLPPATQEVLKQAACLGNSAEIALLALVHGGSDDETRADVWEAARVGLVLLADETYKFLHDRVQEAAYSLIPETQRPSMHLRIGRLLISRFSEATVEERVFEIASQWNRAVDLITDERERESLCRFNFLAGVKAKRAIAYASALNYLIQATKLLRPDAWDAAYEETLAIYLERSECEYLVGNFELAEELFNVILEKARSNADRAKAYRLRLRLRQVAGHFDEGLAAAFEALRLFGVTLPESDEEIQAATDAEIREISVNLGGRRIAELVDAPVATDRDARTIISLLVESISPAYIARPKCLSLVIGKAVNFSLRYGNTSESCFAYSCYASICVGRGDVTSAFAFSEMSLRLNEKFDDAALKGRLLHIHACFVNFWWRHVATSLPILDRGFFACQEAGDLVYAGFLAFQAVWQTFERGDSLEETVKMAEKCMALTKEHHNDRVFAAIRLEQQLVLCLKGLTREPLSFDTDTFDEAACLAEISKAALDSVIAYHHVMKQMAAFIYGRHEEALEFSRRAAAGMRGMLGSLFHATSRFYAALTMASLYAQAPVAEQQRFKDLLREELTQQKFWADTCPENFLNRYALVAAEMARVEERDLEAMRLYDQAIRSAAENGFLQNEALACELAANFYRARGFEQIFESYLSKAYAGYARWGADGKVKQLEALHPWLAASATRRGAVIAQLDTLSVVKASQAISGQIVLEQLLDTLMRIVLESAGAQKGSLVLLAHEGLSLAADAGMGSNGVDVRIYSDKRVSSSDLPESLLNYVHRSRERVILPDARKPNHFSADAYLSTKKPKSVLCVPILRNTGLIGLLYLENNLVTDAFTADRLAVLELLASQAAISLETARLYAELKRAEEALRESQELVQGIIDNSTAVIYAKDLDGRYLLVNRRFEELFRAPKGSLVGKTSFDVLPEDQARILRAHDLEVLKAGQALEWEETVRQDDGPRTFLSSRFPLRDAKGRVFATCGIATDITERKKLEDQVLQLQKMESVGRLAGGVAHDFNNILTAILGYADIVRGRLPENAPVLDEVQQIKLAADRASRLTRQLLTFARRSVVKPEVLDLGSLSAEVSHLLRRLIGEDVELVVHASREPSLVQADTGQLEQVLVNLAVNARDAMPRGGKLTIETSTVDVGPDTPSLGTALSSGKYVRLTVADTGTGMSETTKAHIFEPFFTTKEKGKGTGLGLATSYGIVQQSGGHIFCRSELGRGTTFEVYLPRFVGRQKLSDLPQVPLVLQGTETVLLVEDEPSVRAIARRGLEAQGYRVLEAGNGLEALKMVAAHQGDIEILVTDVVMPQMGGPELAQRLRATRPDLRVLFTSGYTDYAAVQPENIERGTMFLHKPFTTVALARAVRDVLG